MKADKPGRYQLVSLPLRLAAWSRQNNVQLQLIAPGFNKKAKVIGETVNGDDLLILISGKNLPRIAKGQEIPVVKALVGAVTTVPPPVPQ